MLDAFIAENLLDLNGNPAGGSVTGKGLKIEWQNGPLGRGPERQSPNGCFVETVIAAALQRIQWFQTASAGKFACPENKMAIERLEEALEWLKKRTADREVREVEGTHAA